jgi:hypothetical protein
MGLATWTTDQAGPFQTRPYPGSSWESEGQPKRQAHEYVRNGTAKVLTLFIPSSGHVRVKESWFEGLSKRPSLPDELPPLRALLVMDNLTGHKTPIFVQWLIEHSICPLYTPLGGSWLNMSESIQRILQRRALAGQSPETPAEIIEWFEATARGWNRNPTPFVWGGKRAARRERSRARRHALGGSGAYTKRPIRRRQTKVEKWRSTNQVTH